MKRGICRKIDKITGFLKVSEVFSSIQGEGRYVGYPVLFLRLSGCTRKCWYCDSSYHEEGVLLKIRDVEEGIRSMFNLGVIVVTGGEPLLQKESLFELMGKMGQMEWHLETNGDLIKTCGDFLELRERFSYICVSPKDKEVVKRICGYMNKFRSKYKIDIKIVTDLEKVGVDMVQYATMLMPLTTGERDRDVEIRKRVWKYCLTEKLIYSPRLQVEVFGYEARRV